MMLLQRSAACILATAACLTTTLGAAHAQSAFLIRDVRVFDGERTLERRWVMVDSGRIRTISGSEIDTHASGVWRRVLGMTWPAGKITCKATDDAMRQLVQAQVQIVAGTDAPIPGTAYGASLHGELAQLVRNGLTPEMALAAATSVPARIFRLSDRGAIRPGMRADLVLVDGDPTRDILATRRIVAIWKRGVRVERERIGSR